MKIKRGDCSLAPARGESRLPKAANRQAESTLISATLSNSSSIAIRFDPAHNGLDKLLSRRRAAQVASADLIFV
jgi:hypothetical protein